MKTKIHDPLACSRPASFFIHLSMLVICLTAFLPFLSEIAKSLSFPTQVDSGFVTFWPRQFTFGNYQYLGNYPILLRIFANTVFVTVIGTCWTTFMTAMMAYPLSRPRREFPAGPAVMLFLLITMVFSNPLIPYYIAIRKYGMMDSLIKSLILTQTLSGFIAILVMLYFKDLEEELFDAARMDGAGDFRLFIMIALPLSKAVLAATAVFNALAYWNMFLHPMMFIRSSELMVLQPFVRSIFSSTGDVGSKTTQYIRNPFADKDSMKSALTVLSTLPIILVYPLLQKYFIQGMRLGAIKG